MRTDTKSRHRTKVGGNVFRDLGFSSTEAKRLLANANVQLEESIRLKKRCPAAKASGGFEAVHHPR